jgi:hypothetical protein
MALSKAKVREILSTAGVDSEHMSAAVDAIIDGNVASIEALREDVAKYKADAEKLADVQKELDALKANNGDDYKTKYEKEHKAFEDFKNDVTAKQTRAAKEAAARAYFEGKNITGANLDIAMRGARDEIDGLEMDGDKIKDTAALDALVSGTYAGLVVTTTKQGVNTATPPANGGKSIMTKDQIIAIKDTAERQKAIADNHELFGF